MAQISEEDRAELVAYLDGELDEQASQAFEAKLTRDTHLRAEAEALKKTWELLDYLPKAEPSTSFTNQTLERIAVRGTDTVGPTKRRGPAWLMPVGWAAAMLIAMTGGLMGGHYFWPASNQVQNNAQVDLEAQINLNKDVILNKRLLENGAVENGNSISFLRALAQEFGDEDD